MVEYGTDPQADAQPGDQCADTDGMAAFNMTVAGQRPLACTAPAELRPPPEHAEKLWHWIERREPGFPEEEPVQEVFYWDKDVGWLESGISDYHWPDEMPARGYRYLGPAEWRPEVPPTVDAVSRLRGALDGAIEAHRQLTTEHATARARIAELEAEVARPRSRLSATWEHLPDVTARPPVLAWALRFSR